eukprot:3151384-Amphidinium_carterae.1
MAPARCWLTTAGVPSMAKHGPTLERPCHVTCELGRNFCGLGILSMPLHSPCEHAHDAMVTRACGKVRYSIMYLKGRVKPFVMQKKLWPARERGIG